MEILGSIYTEVSEKFQNGILKGEISRCIKAEKHDLGVVMAEVKQIGNIAEEKKFSNPQTGRIYDVGGCSPTLSTMQGGGREPKIIVAMRGRNPDDPSDRTAGSPTEQRLEPNTQGISNRLTSVQKDNLVLIKQATKEGSIECEIGGCFDASYPERTTRRGRVQDKGNICPTLTAQNQEIVRIESKYRIRKFTPRECGRLMGVSDEDIVIAKTLADANAAMEAGKYVACEDANFVSQANLVECAIDATGVPDVRHLRYQF